MFINISNHPSTYWQTKQLKDAHKWGEIVDYPFPQVSPSIGEEDLSALADKVISEVCELANHNVNDSVLHIMGEMTFTFMLVTRFCRIGYRCIASTTSRTSEVFNDGTKISHFEFIRFRDYSY